MQQINRNIGRSYADWLPLLPTHLTELIVSLEGCVCSLGDDVQREELKLHHRSRRHAGGRIALLAESAQGSSAFADQPSSERARAFRIPNLALTNMPSARTAIPQKTTSQCRQDRKQPFLYIIHSACGIATSWNNAVKNMLKILSTANTPTKP